MFVPRSRDVWAMKSILESLHLLLPLSLALHERTNAGGWRPTHGAVPSRNRSIINVIGANPTARKTEERQTPPIFDAAQVDWTAVHTLASCTKTFRRISFLLKVLGAIMLTLAVLFSGAILFGFIIHATGR